MDEGKKKIEVFDLNLSTDIDRYQYLLNDPSINIYKEAFAYTGKGEPKITVWYEEDE